MIHIRHSVIRELRALGLKFLGSAWHDRHNDHILFFNAHFRSKNILGH